MSDRLTTISKMAKHITMQPMHGDSISNAKDPGEIPLTLTLSDPNYLHIFGKGEATS